MDEVGDLLERLGRHIGRIERHYSRAGERFARRFDFRFGHDDDEEEALDVEGDEVIERELHFGEQPELKLTANLMNVHVRQVGPGEQTRLVLKGRDLDAVEVETGTWDNAAAVELRIARGFRAFGGFSRRTAYIYVPAGTRVRGRADAGSVSVDGLQDGELDLRTDAGKLRVENSSGRMRLRSSAGKLTVSASSGVLDVRADAGKVQVDDFTGRIEARADAGAISCTRLRLEPGESSARTSMGSIEITLVPDVPVRIEARASLGSVSNKVGEGPRDAPASLSAHTELGAIRIRYDEPPPTPLRSVPLADERGQARVDAAGEGGASGGRQGIPLDVDEREAPPSAGGPRQTAGETAGGQENETLRILAMLERHEITAAEASALLAALRR